MSGSAATVRLESDRDPAATKLAGANAPAKAANDSVGETENNNAVKRMVDEICQRMGDTHELRQELLARGVTFHVVNSLVESGIKDNQDQLESLLDGALAASRNAHGPQAITEADLRDKLDQLITVEKDLRHSRQLAASQGLHMQAVNHLTQIIRANPGDGGVNAVNTLVAYADASGVSLDRVRRILEKHTAEAVSVLPDIAREELLPRNHARNQLLSQIAVGCCLGVIMMWLVL